MVRASTEERVADILQDFSGLESAKELFRLLDYDRARGTLARDSWSEQARTALAEDPQVIATHGDFHVVYARLASDKRLLGPERAVINTLLREHPYSLFLFSTENELLWHFVNARLPGGGTNQDHKEACKRRLYRRITIREKETRLRTATERISKLDLAALQPKYGQTIPPLEIQTVHDEAFNVEAVTKEFFEAYEGLFNTVMSDLKRQTQHGDWSHDYSLQLLNRTMFLYFVQRKGWLGTESEFLKSFWSSYRRSGQRADTFFSNWLTVLFFNVFNKPAGDRDIKDKHIPDHIRSDLSRAPYLNGGLFDKNPLDHQREEFQAKVTDGQFEHIFDLFERYNFTIAENSPLDQEVAVDPEMIGKVYETLVRVSETDSTSKELGVVYTPRTEIDLMCRLALVDNLANHLGQQHKNLFYEAVFSLEQEEKEQADRALAKSRLWPDVEKRLKEITVVDPACGSGAFLVGMLHVLDDLLERAERNMGAETDAFERKKRIIGQSLYGVEVRNWACNVAELRLWLSLIADAEFNTTQLSRRKTPLLPYFRFNVRCGDSLVQEVGGIDMGHWRGQGITDISHGVKSKLTELKNEKGRFYRNEQGRKFKTAEELKSQEVQVFKELLQDRITAIATEIETLERQQHQLKPHRQMRLNGSTEDMEQFTLRREELERHVKERRDEKGRIESILRMLLSSNAQNPVPFVWDIAFAELFSGGNHGFDIVVGNPPYIKHQEIVDPSLATGQGTTENGEEYKAHLIKSVYLKYPHFFGYEVATEKASHRINTKSDLYIYFYFHGLSLMNEQGSFCFITSNSWLDADYGADLQEFLLNRCRVKLIIDNKVRRVFKEADINTVIVLLGAPQKPNVTDDVSLENTAKFVVFGVPFDEVLHPVLLQGVEEAATRKTTSKYRVFPIAQNRLLADGSEYLESPQKKNVGGPLIKTAKYIGNKWGGKYLRAPDIYWTIMEKGNERLTVLKAIAEVNEGKPTGANDFFYPEHLTCESFGIESEFLHPGIMKTRGANYFKITRGQLDRCFLAVDKPVSLLRGTGALEYIRFGEQQGLNKRNTFAKKNPWYRFRARKPADLLLPCGFGATFFCALNEAQAVSSNSFTELRLLHPERDLKSIWIWMNSAICWLYVELMGRTSLGGGMLKMDPTDYRKMPILKGELFPDVEIEINRKVKDIFGEMKQRDRRLFDSICFEVLGLTKGEQDAVYEAVTALVEARLKKASSLKEANDE